MKKSIYKKIDSNRSSYRKIPISRPSLGDDELNAVSSVFKTGWLGMGETVQRFEHKLAEIFSGFEVVAVNSGTTALHIALEALDIGQGDEVIVPAMTFAGTVQAITQTGAVPVFCDVEPDTLNSSPKDIERKITPRTKLILPVHFRGFPCDMDAIAVVADKNSIAVVEDAAHAFGSFFKDKPIGTIGDITCFSFDPIKNITCGEGGAIVTGDSSIAEKIRKMRALGIDRDAWQRYKREKSWSYDIYMQGYRYHMSNINAAIGIEQLKRFELNNKRKIEAAKIYDKEFGSIKEIELLSGSYDRIGLFCYIIKVKKERRDDLIGFLNSRDIIAGVHYIPCHYFTFYKRYATDLPVTEKVFNEIVTLPLFPSISDEEVMRVVSSVKEFFKD